MNGSALYLRPLQASNRPPSAWENELADVLEAAFADGAWELEPLLARLNASRVHPPRGGVWDAATFTETMRELGA